MLDQILQLVKQYGQQSVVDNPEVPNEVNQEVLAEAGNTITNGFQNMASGGGLESILSLFTGNQGNNSRSQGIMANPMIQMMVGHLAQKLISKMKLNPATANSIATNIIPNVINSMVSKTASNDPANDGFDLNDLIASFTGGSANQDNTQTNGFDFQGLLNQITGGGNGSGCPDIGQLIPAITARAQQHQQQQQGQGGLANLIAGFFK